MIADKPDDKDSGPAMPPMGGGMGVPVTICGFALLHHVARARQLGGTLLTVGYVVWVLVDIAKIGLLLAVLLDAFFEIISFGRLREDDHPNVQRVDPD